jgi:hypothetical protein
MEAAMKAPSSDRRLTVLLRLWGLLGLFLCTGLLPVPALAAAGDPLWNDEIDPGFGDTSARVVAVSDGHAFVAGAGPFQGSPSSNANIRVRAYDLASGNLLWENVWDASGVLLDDDVADLAARSGRTFVAGSGGTNSSSTAFVVRAYESDSGAVLWEDHCGTFSSYARSLAATARRVFAAGRCQSGTDTGGVLRAYSAADGAILWDARDIDTPWSVTVAGTEVIAAGTDGSGALVLHAYSAADGRLLWTTTSGMPVGLSLRAVQLVYGDGFAYLSWSAVDGNSVASNGLEAYRVGNGRISWQAEPGDRVNGLVLERGRLFAAEAGNTVLAAGYAAKSGRLLWQDQPGTASVSYAGLAAAAADGQFLLAGNSYDPASEQAQNFLIRAYSLGGRLLWQDDEPTTTVQGASFESVAAGHGVAVASGWNSRSTPPFGTTHWLVRAYATDGHGGGR